RGCALLDDTLEAVHVGPPGEDVALGPPDERAGVGALDLIDAGDERAPGVVAEQVERRVGEDHHGEVALALERYRCTLRHRTAFFLPPPLPPPSHLLVP